MLDGFETGLKDKKWEKEGIQKLKRKGKGNGRPFVEYFKKCTGIGMGKGNVKVN